MRNVYHRFLEWRLLQHRRRFLDAQTPREIMTILVDCPHPQGWLQVDTLAAVIGKRRFRNHNWIYRSLPDEKIVEILTPPDSNMSEALGKVLLFGWIKVDIILLNPSNPSSTLVMIHSTHNIHKRTESADRFKKPLTTVRPLRLVK